MKFEELPVGSRIAIEKFDDWKRYTEAHGFFPKEIGAIRDIMLRTRARSDDATLFEPLTVASP
jgi:hypothetical protein